MSEPTASTLAADVREVVAVLVKGATYPAMEAETIGELLDALVAQVDTLTRDVRTAMDAAERFREQGMKDAERAEAAEAALTDMRRALEDFAKHGTRFDTNPTVMVVNDKDWMRHHQWWVSRATDMDRSVRERARRALAGDTKEARDA